MLCFYQRIAVPFRFEVNVLGSRPVNQRNSPNVQNPGHPILPKALASYQEKRRGEERRGEERRGEERRGEKRRGETPQITPSRARMKRELEAFSQC